jgi:hypothetical protein
MKKFTADNTQGYLPAELDWLNYMYEKAIKAEVESWDRESERYLDWQSGLSDEDSPENIEWTSHLAETVITDYDDEFVKETAVANLYQEAMVAGDMDLAWTAETALQGGQASMNWCLEVIFSTRKQTGE